MSGEDIGDLYDDFMSLINQGYYNKNETDDKYLKKDLEINLEENGKLYIVDTPQGSLELINDYLDVEVNDVIILKGVLKDIEDDPISHVKMNLVENNEIIDTGVTDNNGVVEYSYSVTDEQEHSLKALTRYSESNSEIIKGVPHVFEITFTVDNAPVTKFSQMFIRQYVNRVTTVDGLNNIYVDWGDGSELETIDKTVGNNKGHNYSVNGEYVMKIYNVNCPVYIFKYDSDLNGLSVKSPMLTCNGGLSDTKFKKIVLSNKIKNLPSGTCAGSTELLEVVLPSKLESMGQEAFASCSKLETIELPSTLKSIGVASFASCSKLETIELPSVLETIGESAFYGTGLININIPRSVTVFGVGMFYGCNNLRFVVFNWVGDEIITFGNGKGDTWVIGNRAIIIPDNSMSDYVDKDYPVNNLYEQGATLTLTSNKQELTEDEEVTLTATLINNGNVENKNVTFEIYNSGEIIESLTATTNSSGVATTTYTVTDDVIIKSTVAGGGIESNTVSITFPKQLLDIKVSNGKRGVSLSKLYSIDDEYVTNIIDNGESNILDIPYGEYTIKIENKPMPMVPPRVIKVLKNPFVYNRLNYQFSFDDDDDFEDV